MARQMTECTRCLLVMSPYRPQKNSQAATKYGSRWRIPGIVLFFRDLTCDDLFEIGVSDNEEGRRYFNADARADEADGA